MSVEKPPRCTLLVVGRERRPIDFKNKKAAVAIDPDLISPGVQPSGCGHKWRGAGYKLTMCGRDSQRQTGALSCLIEGV